jgi:hypothetical protein
MLIIFFMAANLSFNKRLVDKRVLERSIGAIFYPQKFITPVPPTNGNIILTHLVF